MHEPVHSTDTRAAREGHATALTARQLVLLAIAVVACTVIVAAMPQPAPAAPVGPKQPTTRAGLEAQIDRLAGRLERHELRVDRAAAALDEAETRYIRALDAYAEHLAALYQAGDNSRIEMLAEIRDMGSAVDTATYLGRLAEYDRELMDEHRQALRAAESKADALDDLTADAERMESALAAAQTRLATWREPSKVVDLDSIEADDAPLASNFFYTQPVLGVGGMKPPASKPKPAPTAGGGGADEAAPDETPTSGTPGGYLESGVASWYGPGFHGNTTANGETYDMYAMTAAHKTLPFGTMVRVTTNWGSSVVVRINDRGPFVGGRVIDLSYAAAQALGIDGVAPVQLSMA